MQQVINPVCPPASMQPPGLTLILRRLFGTPSLRSTSLWPHCCWRDLDLTHLASTYRHLFLINVSSGSGSPKPKWTGRLNSAVRRSSTMLSFTRNSFSRPSSHPSSIHEHHSSVSASITKQKVNTTSSMLSPPTVPAQVVPSPIHESPVREAAAVPTTEPTGPYRFFRRLVQLVLNLRIQRAQLDMSILHA